MKDKSVHKPALRTLNSRPNFSPMEFPTINHPSIVPNSYFHPLTTKSHTRQTFLSQ